VSIYLQDNIPSLLYYFSALKLPIQNVDFDYAQFYDSPVAHLNDLGLKEQNRQIHDFWSQYVFLLRLRLPLTLSNVALGADSRPLQPLPRWLNILYVYELLSIRYQSDHLSQCRFKLYIHPIRPTFSSQILRFARLITRTSITLLRLTRLIHKFIFTFRILLHKILPAWM